MFPIRPNNLDQLGPSLMAARKEQKLSREALSAVSGLSVSFIRDAEANAGNCTLGNIVQLVSSMGLQVHILGLSSPDSATAMDPASPMDRFTDALRATNRVRVQDIVRLGIARPLDSQTPPVHIGKLIASKGIGLQRNVGVSTTSQVAGLPSPGNVSETTNKPQ